MPVFQSLLIKNIVFKGELKTCDWFDAFCFVAARPFAWLFLANLKIESKYIYIFLAMEQFYANFLTAVKSCHKMNCLFDVRTPSTVVVGEFDFKEGVPSAPSESRQETNRSELIREAPWTHRPKNI